MLVLCASGCAGRASCEEVAQAVAIRTWECTGLSDLGYGRARSMRHHLECTGEDDDAKVVSGRCLEELGELSCAQAEAAGDDPRAWLDATETCGEAFTGEAPSGEGFDTGA